ncbi:MAG TPA: VCBS repeat-containing protein [Deltaproteobacteria bacterium]|nr:VCBS repeat-containing protein [Deltaproteobacteria bacterium]
MPIHASYETYMPHLPATVWKWMVQEVTWPTIARGDDNGDGRIDLFALSRWAIWIYHSGPDGLPGEPTRRLGFVPFDAESERRHEATVHNYFARDLDGDTRADLVLSTIGGGLMDGRSHTQIFMNAGSGVTLAKRPDAVRETEGGFSGFNFVDIDGNGSEEIIETTMAFGIVQMIRVLVTRSAETRLRVLVLDPESPGGTRTIFEDDFSFHLDFGEGRISGLIPSLGDWNGDGIQDLFVARSDDEIGFRLGSIAAGKSLFGRVLGRQRVPLPSGESRIADLDGDGLDEIVAFNDTDPDQPLLVLHNQGRFPGTRPRLRGPTK